MTKIKIFFLAITMMAGCALTAQVSINNDNSTPDGSAMLDVKSTDKGFLPPRMTSAQRDAIASPAPGLMIFNADANTLQYYNSTVWENTNGTSCVPATPGIITGNVHVYFNATGEVYSIAAIPYATSYFWTVPADATITAGQGTTSITVDFVGAYSNVNVRAESGCGTSDYSNLFINMSFVDERDGQSYITAEIGNQVWMAENLAFLPAVSPSSTGSETDPYYYVHGYQGTDVAVAKATTIYQTYGALYNWAAVMQGAASSNSNPSGVQGVCPDGWHVPSDAELTELTTYVGNNGHSGTEGTALKSTTGWNNNQIGGNGNGTDNFGFTGLAGGSRSFNGSFTSTIGSIGYWWFSTEGTASNAWYRVLSSNFGGMLGASVPKSNSFSVRCLRD